MSASTWQPSPVEPADPWLAVAAQLSQQQQKLMLIEASAGGAVCAAASAAPGASGWFAGGVVAYADELKTGVLGVSPRTIAQYGAVSPEVVLELLRGAPASADWVLVESGIYGPGGARPGKPVGTVILGLRHAGFFALRTLALSGERAQIRDQVEAACAAWLLNEARLRPAR